MQPRAWWSHARVSLACALCDRFLIPDDPRRYRDHIPAAQARSLGARALLRALLNRKVNPHCARSCVAHHPGGAPFLPAWPACAINVSHSGDYVVAAACTSTPIGIDIEREDLEFDMAPLVRRFFHPLEARSLAALAAGERTGAFFAWWAAKEAVAKCLHQGLVLPLDSFAIVNPLGSGPAIGLGQPVWVTALAAPRGYRAALAWQGAADTLRHVQHVDLRRTRTAA